MNIWMALFLVLSAVVLASPFLSSRSTMKESMDMPCHGPGRDHWEDEELELDLLSGRLAREDYEAMTGNREGERR